MVIFIIKHSLKHYYLINSIYSLLPVKKLEGRRERGREREGEREDLIEIKSEKGLRLDMYNDVCE